MQQLKSGIKSSKIATLAGIVLAMAYVVPEFIENTRDIRTASYGIGKQWFGKNIPLPARKPRNIPEIAQPEQFDLASLDAALSTLDYRLKDIRNGAAVPRFFVDQIPVDILDTADIEFRKSTFIKVVLPLILDVNEKIEAQRERLSTLLEARMQGKSLRKQDRKWLEEMAARYGEDTVSPSKLLLKVDKVPVSLALAQAVEESGWGTSRFAREGNALFGQRVWATGKGIVPEDRAEDETHEVKAFSSIADSIKAYVHNLNTHAAYTKFREMRARSHSESGFLPEGLELISTLHVYSEKGQEYIDNLRSLIETNRFDDFEDAVLAPEQLADIRL